MNWVHVTFSITESDDLDYRVTAVQAQVQKLPEKNMEMLDLLVGHLVRYATSSSHPDPLQETRIVTVCQNRDEMWLRCEASLTRFQGLRSKPGQPHDCAQPGRGLWANANAVTRGDGGGHNEHQVPEPCGGDSD